MNAFTRVQCIPVCSIRGVCAAVVLSGVACVCAFLIIFITFTTAVSFPHIFISLISPFFMNVCTH